MAYHILSLFVLPIIRRKSLGSSSPMKVLLTILLIVWNGSILFLEKGQDYWVPIFVIILFNGGLIILFLFTVSIIPKEKDPSTPSVPLYLLILISILTIDYLMEIKRMGEFLFQNWVFLLIGSVIITLYFLGISLISIDLFKRVKSL